MKSAVTANTSGPVCLGNPPIATAGPLFRYAYRQVMTRVSENLPTREEPVLIIGGGWAGLAAAVKLTHHGYPVTVLESARQLGGRARCVAFENERVDNGQHLMLGAYTSLQELLSYLGIHEQDICHRMPLSLTMQSRDGALSRITAPRFLPAPLHLIMAFLLSRGLGLVERMQALRLSAALGRPLLNGEPDTSVLDLLHQYRQPPHIIRTVWEPLCIATMNTRPSEASAGMFLRVLNETFGTKRRYSDLLVPKTDLGTALPDPALDYIERRGGSVRLCQRVTALAIRENCLRGVEIGALSMPCRHAILAVPHAAALRLIRPHEALTDVTQNLSVLDHAPICTLYLRYPRHVSLGYPFLGLYGTTVQWLFDRGYCAQPGLIAAVISADGPHMKMSNDALSRLVEDEIAACRPDWPRPDRVKLIREKRATFIARVGIDSVRPGNTTAVTGLCLAGDYTATGLPATLEGAIRSGFSSAELVIGALTRAADGNEPVPATS